MSAPDPRGDEAERIPSAVRSHARRERQLGEIVTAIIDGDTTRAAGLAAEHGHEFPHDADLLDALLRARSGRDRRW